MVQSTKEPLSKVAHLINLYFFTKLALDVACSSSALLMRSDAIAVWPSCFPLLPQFLCASVSAFCLTSLSLDSLVLTDA